MNEYQNVLLDSKSTMEQKNDAYNALQSLNNSKSECEKIEKMIYEKYKFDNFVKIDKDTISIVIASKNHSTETANNIIRSVQELYDNPKYITVKFE